MRKLVVSEFITLDGVFEDPGGAEGFKFGGWSMQFNSAESGKYKFDELLAADALLLGRITYDGFAKAWPTAEGTGEFGERMNSLPKYVVSSAPDKLEWNNSHLVQGDIAQAITKLKNQPGKDILVAGSGQLVRFLLDNNLVDRLCLMVHPIILGTGKQLFTGTSKNVLKLAATKAFDSGSIVLEYTPK